MAENATKQPSVAAGSARRTGTRRAETQGMQGMGGPLTAMASLASASGNHAVSGLLGGGTALPPQVLAEMESRFGQSFADVRIHDDSRAHASAAGLQAKAYTHGQHIVFGAHRFAPHAGEGKRLMAHELAHVVQQRRGGSPPALDAGAAHEQSADAAASAVVGGQGSVAVAGGTAVGVARDEDDSWGARLRRKAHALKESIPEEYREKLQAAGDYAADKAVDVMVAPLGPAAMYAADGLGSSLLHSGQKLAAGESNVSQDLKNFGRDKVQEGLGAAKGVVTQLTEVADTAMWVGNEYKDLRDSAAKKVGGKEGSFGNEAVKKVIDTTARILPGTGALPDLANASDAAKEAGLIDEDTKQASLTAPMSKKLNEYAKAAEEALGASPREPEMFSPMEKAELASNLVTQVALSFTGAEEVKVAMNVVGALSGLRGIVESIRNEKDWKTSSRFWGSLIGMGLSIVGLKHSLAAGKITTLILKFGWVAAAIPPLAQMATDYYFLETHPELDAQQRKDVEARIKQGWVAAIHVIKDAILHVAQSQGGNSAKPGAQGEEGSQTASKGGGTKAGGEGETPAAKPAVAEADPAPAAKPVADAPANAAPAASVATPASPPTTTTTAKPPAITNPAAAASSSTAGAPSNLRPLRGAKPAAPSAASAKLEQALSRQPASRKGSVTRLQPRAAAEGPGTKPMQQKQPVALAEPQKIAVGQTHGPEPATRPTLVDVSASKANGSAPTVVASSGKGARSGSAPTRQATSPRGAGASGKGTSGGASAAPRPLRSAGRPSASGVPESPTAAKPARPSRSKSAPARKGASRTPTDELNDFKKMLSGEFGAEGDLSSGKLIELYRHGSRATVTKYVKQSLMKQAQALRAAGGKGPQVLELGDFKLELKTGQSVEKQVDAFVKKLEGAHSMPQAFGKRLPADTTGDLPGGKYNPDDALVQFTDKPVHTAMDQPWKDAFNALHKSGQKETTAGKVYDMVADGIRKTPGMSDAEKASRIARLHDEMFTEMKLDPKRSYSVPRVYSWLEILGFKSKGKGKP